MFRKPPYYLTAYGLAVREGFTGTLEQWLESLRGEKGDGVELRYQDDKLQWRSVPPEGAQIPEGWEEDEWKDLLELEDIRGPVVEQTLEQAQQAAQEATEAAGEAELMASHAQGHEQRAAQYAQEALEAARFVAVTMEYAVSEDGSTPPKAWETDIPEMTAEKPFLWMKVNKNYTDGTAAADVGVIGRYSADGKDGSSTTITLKYGVSSTPSMNTITGWQDTIPQMSETYPYLWIEISTETTTATGGSSTVEAGIIGYYSTPDSGGNGNQGTGLTSTEKNLMLTLFKAVPYQTDVSKTIKSLEAIWNSGGGGGDTPDVPGVTTYTIAYNLTNVTTDFIATSVTEGESITVNLTPDTNAVLGEVVVIMGGVDVTATAYSNGKISISSVTGNVVITATATVANYTQVEYLEAATTKAYMVTPVSLRATDLVECVWTTSAGGWIFPFGAYADGVHCSLSSRADGVAGRTKYTRRSGATYTNTNTADPNFVMPTGAAVYRFTESAPGTGAIYAADGNALVTLTDESVSGYSEDGCRLGLFWIVGAQYAMHGSAEGAGLRIHSFKITDVYGVATLDLIPVLDADGVACMYDKVSGEYLYDASGANGFTAGGAV